VNGFPAYVVLWDNVTYSEVLVTCRSLIVIRNGGMNTRIAMPAAKLLRNGKTYRKIQNKVNAEA
jgi:hypothetical protein